MDHEREDRGVFQEDFVIATLKQMTTLLAETIEADDEGTFQPMHPCGQVWLRSFEGKMEMIAHAVEGDAHVLAVHAPKTRAGRATLPAASRQLPRASGRHGMPAAMR